MITEKNNPTEILNVVLLNFFILNIINDEKIAINIRYKGFEASLNRCKSTSVKE